MSQLFVLLQSGWKTDPLGEIKKIMNWGLHLGEGEGSIHITLGLLITLVLAIVLTSWIIRIFKKVFTRNMSQEDRVKTFTVIRFVKYVVYLVVILITMSAGGIDITLLITASAALFVGLGLALQLYFQDILGGIFIISDKSVQVGDVVRIDDKVCRVFEIKLRTTRAVTRDDKVVIIPNHKFVTDIAFNYTQNYPTTREAVSVGVAYGSDVQLVSDILIDCVRQDSRISDHPEPFVLFEDFGDSALIFSVHFFLQDSFQALKVQSNIRYLIDAKFRENNIRIPFPQRDVHLYQSQPFYHSESTGEDLPEAP